MHDFYNDQHESKQDKAIKKSAKDNKADAEATKEFSTTFGNYSEAQRIADAERDAKFDKHSSEPHGSADLTELTARVKTLEDNNASPVNIEELTKRVKAIEDKPAVSDPNIAERVTLIETKDKDDDKTINELTAKIIALETQLPADYLTAITNRVVTLESAVHNHDDLAAKITKLEAHTHEAADKAEMVALANRVTALEVPMPDDKLRALEASIDEKFTAVGKRIDELIITPGLVR